ncbi:MAG: gliding motility protein GldL [Flavobacterium sp.]|uniref:gliding motility protein GldL n=1 Tax=Flavobacterium sp. TaxID=239 RepID=UPI0022BFB492|nr:gliding motility protein GldL [Flavobacterium sp.]MCZ8197547.1 gliding motility protein GldL [Flavobacterium sp.]
MKNKYIIAFFVLGVIVTSIGALFKITHLEIGIFTGNLLITLGVFIKVIAAILFIIKLFSNNNNDFLNK